MNKFLASFAIFVLMAMIQSCSSDSPQPNGLLVSDTQLCPSGDGATKSIEITYNGKWSASVAEDASQWISLSATSGVGNAKITLNIAPNNNGVDRKATLTFTNAEGLPSASVEVLQNCSALSAPECIIIEANGGTKHLSLADEWANCDVQWISNGHFTSNIDNEILSSPADWAHAQIQGQQLMVSATAMQANTQHEARSGKVILKSKNATKYITVIEGDIVTYNAKDATLNVQQLNDSELQKTLTIQLTGDNELGRIEIPFIQKGNSSVTDIKAGCYEIIPTENAAGNNFVKAGQFDAKGFDLYSELNIQWDGLKFMYMGMDDISVWDFSRNENIKVGYIIAGSAFNRGIVFIEKISNDQAYVYVAGDKVNISSINPDKGPKAFRVLINANFISDNNSPI